METPSPNKEVERSVARLGPSLLFSAVLLVTVPRMVVLENLSDIGPLAPYLLSCALAFVATLSLAVASYLLLPNRIAQLIGRMMFATAVFVFVSLLITPLAMQSLESGSESPSVPARDAILDILLLTLAIGLATKLPRKLLENVALATGLALLASEVLTGYQILASNRNTDQTLVATRPLSASGFTGNVYHFVFDAFPGNWWEPVVKKLGQQEHFRDFIYFANTRANFLRTTMSMASLTTGRLFDGSGSLEQWLSETDATSTLFAAKNMGFITTAYSIRQPSGNTRAHSNNLSAPISPSLVGDIWLLRIVPAFLRRVVFFEGSGAISALGSRYGKHSSGDIRSYRSLRQFKQMESEERRRKSSSEFLFGYFHVPHAPFQLMRDGAFDPEESNLLEQTYLAVNLMGGFIQQLKAEGKYDSSIIVFQSDHGVGGTPPAWISKEFPTDRMPQEIERAIGKSDEGGRSGRFIEFKSRALLLVKAPGASHDKVQRVDQLAQLLDIHGLLIATMNAPADSDFEKIVRDSLASTSVVLNNGFTQKNSPEGNRVEFGQNITSGFMSRYSVDEEGSWSIGEKMAVQW